MSTKILATPNLGLLIASLTQALWHALAFRQAASVRALGTSRAHVLHARTPIRRVPLPPPRGRSGPSPLPVDAPDPSHVTELPLELHNSAVRSATAASGRPQQPLPWIAPPEPLALASCPLEKLKLVRKPVL